MDILWLAVVLLVIALIAYALGLRGLAWFTADIGKFLFWVFVVLFIITLIFRLSY